MEICASGTSKNPVDYPELTADIVCEYMLKGKSLKTDPMEGKVEDFYKPAVLED